MSTERRPNEQRPTERRTTGNRARAASSSRASSSGTSRTTRNSTSRQGAPKRSDASTTKAPARTGAAKRRTPQSAEAARTSRTTEGRARQAQSAQRSANSRTRTRTTDSQHAPRKGAAPEQVARRSSRAGSGQSARRGTGTTTNQRTRTRDTQSHSRTASHSARTNQKHATKPHASSPAPKKQRNTSFFDTLREKPGLVAVAAVALVVIIFFGSLIADPKIYKGVYVGDLDLSGMTKEEAAAAISEHYASRVENGQVTIYAGDEGREKVLSGDVVDIGPEEQLSVEDVQANTSYWKIACTDVGAYIDSNGLAEKAYQVGRSDGGFLTRMGSALLGTKLPAECTFDSSSIELLATKIDSVMGNSRIDWNIEIINGYASVSEGSDGMMVNRGTLKTNLSNAFVDENSSSSSFTAYVENTPVRIDKEAAQKAADMVNDAIADGVSFSYEGQNWTSSPSDVGEWISSTVASDNGTWVLQLGVRQDKFSSSFFSHVLVGEMSEGLAISFVVKGNDVTVHTNCEGSMPKLEPARADLEKALFSNGGKKSTGQPAKVNVDSGPVPESLSFDEALESGIIAKISSYTTEYTTGTGTEARNTNIRIGADYLNNSICKARGGEWSFNGLVGDTTPDKGYQAAGSIAMGEYVDTYGGGICQVATTVFNALYESPYKITKRYNHSLHIASYPEGRDAAISWDNLDLTWCNESASDVLMKTSCNENSVTVSLYSVPVKFNVTSDVGEWEEGEKYTISVKYDENLSKGYSYVKQSGADGSKITVVRTVYDGKGNVKYSNTFASVYLPKEEIVVAGPGTEVDTHRD